MVLAHTVLADTAVVGAAEDLQGPLVALAGPPLDVPQRLHQTVGLELRVLQVWPQVGLAVGHQADEAGLEGPAGVLDTGVTHHIIWTQGFLLHHLRLHLLILLLFRVLVPVGCWSWTFWSILLRLRLVLTLLTLRADLSLVLEAGAADQVTTGGQLVWAGLT